MRRLLACLLIAFAMSAPVRAQDVTPAATPEVVTVTAPGTTVNVEQPAAAPPSAETQLFDLSKALPYLAVILLLLVLITIEVVDKRRLAELAAKSLTPEAFAIVAAAINKGVADAGIYVKGTESTLDDALYTPTKAQIDSLLARIRALEDEKSAQVVNNINPSPPAPPTP